MSYNLSSSSLPGMVSQYSENGLNAATSMPNLGPMGMMNGNGEVVANQQMNDNDEDYNLTLTPDMAAGIRQAMSICLEWENRLV
ncbi:unnamed protein product, partial [Mesorhabditis belari]|uniref:Uncharacterized protein n=1 Tax=Mesorhabditis belari TaxID=2138241 RepID=A0AAF3EEY5_9BILA